LDFSRDEVFGVYNRRLELIALGHLALEPGPTGLPEPIGQPAAAAANLAQAVESASQTLGQPPALRQDGEGVADRVAGTEIGEAAQAERRAAGICAELGMSVRSEDRGVGLGKRLFERAAMLARNHGVRMLFIQALSENDAMLAIARQAGARVEAIGSESEAYLLLEAPDLDSRLTEVVEEQVAEADYLMKAQAKQFWDLLAQVMAVRKALFHWPGG
jgi:GNAT superfamily N-acetyltransferase